MKKEREVIIQIKIKTNEPLKEFKKILKEHNNFNWEFNIDDESSKTRVISAKVYNKEHNNFHWEFNPVKHF
ncbi:hypothetical protein A2Z67_04075 [Candidatus Woesebacteria bacterium RBG_13_36_22]|uniref:Uncharacterized protein n=1 Tax=Candidatus Woesebacteria bacterium RBG_13_36_22 TaxID=1802478 RepID=A0A1F7X6X8_9BACT|nr:MAG: hypothetical protein A2Z67_04075 [Candidatus Woesebacteria bacterium RBG_13_36_22]